MKKIAYQGIKGAFSYLTALEAYGDDHQLINAKSFADVFEMIERGVADIGVIPIENSLAGSVYENYDLLHKYDIDIIDEHIKRIEHCLLAVPSNEKGDARLAKIVKVASHPKALEQCIGFFQKNPWIERVIHSNTAVSAADVALQGDESYAAIASSQAAMLYGLEIVQKSIEDDLQNYTRFVSIAKSKDAQVPKLCNKCTLIMQLAHTPGALSIILSHIAERGYNLTKLESRPLHGAPFNYLFYMEFTYPEMDQHTLIANLHVLKQKTQMLKVLGCYKRGDDLWTH